MMMLVLMTDECGVKDFKLEVLGMHLILFETTFAGSEKPVCKKVQTWSDRN